MNTKIKRKINDYRHSAFTLAEMMIVLLIMSLVLSAFLPIMTKRAKTSGTIWRYSSNNSDFYAGLGATQGAAIGVRDFATGDDAKLLINTTATTQPAILFKENNVETGKLFVDSKSNVALGKEGSVYTGTGNGASVSIGQSSNASGQYGIALGYNSAAPYANAIAIGGSSQVYEEAGISIGGASHSYSSGVAIGIWSEARPSSVAIGFQAKGTGGVSTSIGCATQATGSNSTAIGNASKADGDQSNAMGYLADASADNSNAIGNYAHATGPQSNAIGFNALANADWSIAIGGGYDYAGEASDSNPKATGAQAIAIGYGSNAVIQNSTAIGTNTKATGVLIGGTAIGPAAQAGYDPVTPANLSGYDAAYGPYAHAYGGSALALGSYAKALHSGSVAIGYNAVTTAANQIMLGSGQAVVVPGTLTFQTSGGVLEREVFLDSNGTLTTSDAKLKNISGKSDSGLDKIKGLTVYDFTFKKDKKKTPHVGVMAQELQKIFPNSVQKGRNGYLMIRQDEMFYAMLNSIKELDAMFSDLKAQIKAIVVKVQQLDDKIIALVNVNKINSKKIKDLEAKNKSLEVQNKIFEARLRKLEAKIK